MSPITPKEESKLVDRGLEILEGMFSEFKPISQKLNHWGHEHIYQTHELRDFALILALYERQKNHGF